MSRVSSAILLLFVCLFFAGTSSAIPKSSATPAAIPIAGPWAPLISFVSSLWQLVTGNKQTKQAAQQSIPSTVQQMAKDSAALSEWPKMMEESRSLREDAIALAQQIDGAAHVETVTDELWSDTTVQIDLVEKEFNAIYSKSEYTSLLQTDPIYDPAIDRAHRMWNTFHQLRARPNKSAAERKNTLQQLNGQATTLIESAFLTEYWATDMARNLVSQYQSVAAKAQGKSGNGCDTQKFDPCSHLIEMSSFASSASWS